jgi:hypothetical protein
MASSAYVTGRKRYTRPQAMLWADNPGTLENGLYIPTDSEVLSANSGVEGSQFIVLSDDNRAPLDFSSERIETRERMINGRMRSHHVADKMSLSTSWDMLPSRSFALNPSFDADGISEYNRNNSMQYTTDGGAGGAELLEWYESHQGSFWAFLAYDNYKVFGSDDAAYAHLHQYNQVVEVFFADFQYSVQKRGSNTHDLWNISVTLEEV